MNSNATTVDGRRKGNSQYSETNRDRLPPHSHEAEQMLIGALLSAQAHDSTDDLICAVARVKNAFYDLRHQVIIAAIARLVDSNQPVELVSVVNELGSDREKAGGLAYLSTLLETSAGPSTFDYYASIVVEKHTLRQIIQACSNSVQESYNEGCDVSVVLGNAESSILSIRDSLSGQQQDTMLDGYGLAEQASEYVSGLQSGQSTPRIPTGFYDLDRMVFLESGDLCIIGARPSAGKTSLACNIMINAAQSGISVGMLSLEMTPKALSVRLCSSMSGVDSSMLRGHIEQQQHNAFNHAVLRLMQLPVYIDSGFGLTITHAKARLSRMVKQKSIRLGIVDYLQLLRPDSKGERREQEVASVVRELKSVAGQLGIPLIVLAQLNRDVERGDSPRRPRLSDIRESGATEADADEVIMLHPNPMPDTSTVIKTTLIVAKNRNGPTGDVSLIFRKSITKFESAAQDEPQSNSLPYAD